MGVLADLGLVFSERFALLNLAIRKISFVVRCFAAEIYVSLFGFVFFHNPLGSQGPQGSLTKTCLKLR